MSNPLNKLYAKNKNLPWQVLAGETMIIEPQAKRSFELNSMGTYVWKNIDGKTTLAQIKTLMCSEFEVSEEEASADLLSLTSEMINQSLIVEQV